MRLPVIVASENGHFVARPAYATEPQVTGQTRMQAINALGKVLKDEIAQGRLAFIDLNEYSYPTSEETGDDFGLDTIEVFAPPSIMDYAGVFKDDTELAEIAKEAYRQRELLKEQEWGK